MLMRTLLLFNFFLYGQLAVATEQIVLVVQESPGEIAIVTATSAGGVARVGARGFGKLDFDIKTPIKTEEFRRLAKVLAALSESYSYVPDGEANMAAPDFFNISHVLEGQKLSYRIERNEENERIPIVAELIRYIPKEHRKTQNVE